MVLFFTSLAFAGGVTDTNNGKKGNLFISTGENHGANSVGEWVDSSSFKGEKGDTGATGPQGAQGIAGQDGLNGVDGINGVNGQDGLNGLDGYTPIKGTDYFDGADGAPGVDGVNGQDGLNGADGAIGAQGEKGNTGDKGNEGKKGEQGIQGLPGKGLKDRIELIGEIRILDTKKTTWSVYAGQDVNNRASIVGAKVVFKLGSSYEQRELEKLNARLEKLEGTKQEQEKINNTETYVTPTGFGIRNKF